MEKKKPKFFCDFCGNEVKPNARSCPKCGKFFESVRCPRCGKTGKQAEFLDGCPVCGYAFNSSEDSGSSIKYKSSGKNKNLKGNDSPPWWVLVLLTLIVLGLGFFALYMYR